MYKKVKDSEKVNGSYSSKKSGIKNFFLKNIFLHLFYHVFRLNMIPSNMTRRRVLSMAPVDVIQTVILACG